MSSDDGKLKMDSAGVFLKCGEIFLADDVYTFLCQNCNELFYDLSEFKTHNQLHLNETNETLYDLLDTNVVEDKSIVSSLVKDENDDLSELNRIECEDDIDINSDSIKEEYCYSNDIEFEELDSEDNSDNIESSELKQLKSAVDFCNENTHFEILNVEKLDKKLIEETYCKHCKVYYKSSFHDIEKCALILEKIKIYKGDFIKLLREGILYCSICGRYFEDYKKLYEHHKKEKHCYSNVHCKICKLYQFITSKINLTGSSNITYSVGDSDCSELHEESTITCERCSIDFSSSVEYSLHVITVHKKKNGNSGNKMSSLIAPYKIGSQPFKFKCSLCERCFRKNSQLKLHMRIHTNERPYKCHICSSAFTVSANLKSHIVYKHTEDRPFTCEFEGCNAKFKLFNLKRQHEKRHLPAKFQCEMCGNGYKTNFNLLKHQQSRHVDAQFWPHQCEYCHKRFARPHHLIDHKRIHTGEKPFGCEVCSKFFRKRSALREHKKLHSDKKSYICRICGKGFKQAAGYWGHMKRHPIIS